MEHMPDSAAPVIDDALRALSPRVNDPEIRKPITELGMVESVESTTAGRVAVTILLTVSGCPLKDTLTTDTTRGLHAVARRHRRRRPPRRHERRAARRAADQLRGGAPEQEIPFAQPGSLTRVYAVASGKGGVGKSSVTANLAAPWPSRACGSASSTPTSTASRSRACSGSSAARPRSTT